MVRSAISLEVIQIPRPCPADWNDMRGDERVRFCKHCSLNVYNLSAMTRTEAERMIAEREGHVCIRMYRRADGTVITRDCGGAIKLAAKRLARFATAGAAMALSGVLATIGWTRSAGAAATDANKCEPATVTHAQRAVMGDVAVEVKGKPAPQPPAIMGEIEPMLGSILPPLDEPDHPPATQPATQPVTKS